MIKIKKKGKKCIIDCPPHWILAVTKSEVIALYKCLNKLLLKGKL